MIKLVFNGVAEMTRAIRVLQAGIQGGDVIRTIGKRLSSLGLRELRQLTPPGQKLRREPPTKRMPPGTTVRAGWFADVKAGVTNLRYEALLRNKRADDSPMGNVVLWSLESGAREHQMPARPFGFPYSWRDQKRRRAFGGRRTAGGLILERRNNVSGSGQRVFTQGPIDHPGHKPFKMVAQTRAHLNQIAPFVAGVAIERLARAWANPFSAIDVSVGASMPTSSDSGAATF